MSLVPDCCGGDGGGSGTTNITNETTVVLLDETVYEADNLIPGPAGAAGTAGSAGAPGATGPQGPQGVPLLDSNDGEDSIIPGPTGPPGAAGAAGATGPQGPQGLPGVDGDDGADSFMPGPQGSQGDKGELPMFFSTSTVDSAPGNGFFRYDNSNPTSAVQIFIANATFAGLDISGFVDTWDDSSNLADRGYLTIRANENSSNVVNIFRIVNTTVAGGGYRKVQVVNVVSGGLRPLNNQLCAIAFNRTGDSGLQGPLGPLSFEVETPEDPLMVPGPPGPSGPTMVMNDFTKDLGAANSSGTFDITGLSGLTADKNVAIVQTAQAIASKGNARDEFEMDNIQLTGYVLNSTTIRAYWHAPSVVVGTFAFAYTVAG